MSRIRALIASVIAGVMIATLSVSMAHADPDKVREAKAKLDEISQQVSAIDQEIIEASVRVDEAEAKLGALSKDLEAQEELVTSLSHQARRDRHRADADRWIQSHRPTVLQPPMKPTS
ncbi:MAG: hypothetical protein R2722_16210 [Tessaracoccus sp.]